MKIEFRKFMVLLIITIVCSTSCYTLRPNPAKKAEKKIEQDGKVALKGYRKEVNQRRNNQTKETKRRMKKNLNKTKKRYKRKKKDRSSWKCTN